MTNRSLEKFRSWSGGMFATSSKAHLGETKKNSLNEVRGWCDRHFYFVRHFNMKEGNNYLTVEESDYGRHYKMIETTVPPNEMPMDHNYFVE
jgi:hypothetical protein